MHIGNLLFDDILDMQTTARAGGNGEWNHAHRQAVLLIAITWQQMILPPKQNKDNERDQVSDKWLGILWQGYSFHEICNYFDVKYQRILVKV